LLLLLLQPPPLLLLLPPPLLLLLACMLLLRLSPPLLLPPLSPLPPLLLLALPKADWAASASSPANMRAVWCSKPSAFASSDAWPAVHLCCRSLSSRALASCSCRGRPRLGLDQEAASRCMYSGKL
jgi:hypothetical protein